MKWKASKLGDIRTRTVFALIPRRCTDGYWHWLEYLKLTEELVGYSGDEWWMPKRIEAL